MPIEIPDPFPPWMPIAFAEYGVREIAGKPSNPRIVEYAATTSLKATDDETPWCSSFVSYVLTKAGYESTHSAAARSWLTAGQPCPPRFGAICVFKRPGTPTSGHVAFLVDRPNANVMLVLGGNQTNRVCCASYRVQDLLDVRWPSKLFVAGS